jgi:acetyl-CoA synthetase
MAQLSCRRRVRRRRREVTVPWASGSTRCRPRARGRVIRAADRPGAEVAACTLARLARRPAAAVPALASTSDIVTARDLMPGTDRQHQDQERPMSAVDSSPVPPRPGRNTEPNLRSYDNERKRFTIDTPERFNPVLDLVEHWASEDPDVLALLSLGPEGELVARHTVAQLAADSRRAANALLALGVGRGDRVLVMLPRAPAWYAAMLGAIRIGAVPSPTPNISVSRDVEYRITTLGAVAAITDAQGASKTDDIEARLPTLRHRICWGGGEDIPDGWQDFDALCDSAGDAPTPEDPTSRDDDMVMFFTSGTVSYPKMVLHRQSYGLGHVSTARFWHDLRPGDRHWTISDTGWAKAAWGGLFGQWHERATVVQVALGRPDPDTVLGIVARHGITSFCAPPTIYRMLVQTDLKAHDLSSLRHCTSAGEPLNPEVIRAWSEGTGDLTVYDGYGQTETTAIVANFRAVPVRPGSMGKVMPGWDVEVHDEDGRRAPAGTVGDIAVRAEAGVWPAGLFSGYHGDDAATAGAIRDGWYYTGDKAKVDDDGYFWFEGRSDDVITSSAYRIGPFEVESALIEHPAVVEAAVVGKDDPDRTQIVMAFCILAEGVTPSNELVRELQDHTKRLTAPYKYPREIRFVDHLPKTVSGKIRRSELRQQLASEESS